MRRTLAFVTVAVSVFAWTAGNGAPVSAAPLPVSIPTVSAPSTTTTAGSAMCISVQGTPYGLCLPPVKLPKLI